MRTFPGIPLPRRVRLAARVLWGAVLAFTVFFSLYPREAVDETFSPGFQSYDWLFHGGCYAALSFLHLAAFPRRAGKSRFHARLRAFALCSLLGAVLEVAQTIPAVNRSSSVSDAVCNAVGAALGAFLAPPFAILP